MIFHSVTVGKKNVLVPCSLSSKEREEKDSFFQGECSGRLSKPPNSPHFVGCHSYEHGCFERHYLSVSSVTAYLPTLDVV